MLLQACGTKTIIRAFYEVHNERGQSLLVFADSISRPTDG